MPTYNVPGVWVEEIASFPPSVAQVATAVPAFLGYTQSGTEVTRITSLLEYESLFGQAQPAAFQATVASDGSVSVSRTDEQTNAFLMYYAISMYFRNGGGACYIVPVGNYQSTPGKQHFIDGLAALAMQDEPTLVVLVDAITLAKADYYDLVQQALAQCQKLGDRFAIVDVPCSSRKTARQDVADFRSGIGTFALSYGAAYHPYLQSSLNFQYKDDSVKVPGPLQWTSADKGLIVSCGNASQARVKVEANADTAITAVTFTATAEGSTLTITIPATLDATATDTVAAWKAWNKDKAGFEMVLNGDGSAKMKVNNYDLAPTTQTLAAARTSNTALYNKVKAALAASRVVLPPSSAVAGIFARTDGERGVWKAPANVSVSAAIGPVWRISNDEQGELNIDNTSGKSINAVRDFDGKGTLVWGARTLLGNDNNWRFVPVRRLFITIEESTRKASSFAVFEPNDAATWLKVKAMIDSYLYGLWEQGALAGAKPEQAYYVNVGLGKSMTAQDILEGRMIVKIGVAAVRPAEFIVLQFSHKMQEA